MLKQLLFQIFFSLGFVTSLSCQIIDETIQTQINGWNSNAEDWDELMHDNGSPFQNQIVDQALNKLLPPIDDQLTIFEIACGNGFLTRRFAEKGAKVYAIDSSVKLIELAMKRTNAKLTNQIKFQICDATNYETYNSINEHFDLIICNMVLMDLPEVRPVFYGARKLLKSQGSLIITQTHPCFEKAVGPLFHEIDECDGEIIHTHGVKVISYLESSKMRVKAVPSLSEEHLFFHRSLSNILHIAFEQGFVVDGFEEIAFPKNDSISEHNGWHHLNDIPVIVGMRFKLNSIE